MQKGGVARDEDDKPYKERLSLGFIGEFWARIL